MYVDAEFDLLGGNDKSQAQLVKQAFASGTDEQDVSLRPFAASSIFLMPTLSSFVACAVLQDFEKAKAAEVEEAMPKVENTKLPGWVRSLRQRRPTLPLT